MGEITSEPGTLDQVPKNLLEQIKQLEDIFSVPQQKLKHITNHFVNELTKGLSVKGGSIVSTPQPQPATQCPPLSTPPG